MVLSESRRHSKPNLLQTTLMPRRVPVKAPPKPASLSQGFSKGMVKLNISAIASPGVSSVSLCIVLDFNRCIAYHRNLEFLVSSTPTCLSSPLLYGSPSCSSVQLRLGWHEPSMQPEIRSCNLNPNVSRVFHVALPQVAMSLP